MTASTHATETLLFSVLLQLIVMIGVARLFNNLARSLGQPGVIGEIVAGLALGPSLFGHFFPQTAIALFGSKAGAPITIISQIGLILLMFQIGTAFDFAHLRSGRYRAATAAVAAASVTAPLLLGFGFGFLSAGTLAPGINPVVYSLFCGVAVAITAVPILGRILREFGLTRDAIGVIAISAAAINDVVGWLLLACISAYATSRLSGEFLLWKAIAIVAGIALFWFLLRPLVDWLLRVFPVRNGALAPNLMAFVLCVMFALGLFTNRIGIFTIFGGFAAGLMFHRHTDFVEAWQQQVGQFVLVFFLPVFFTFTGLRTNVLGLSSVSDLGWLAVVLVISILGKILPVYAAARISGLSHWQSTLLGSLMNTRALMELIVLNIGYDLGFLPQKVFTMLVIMAVVTTVMTGPLLQRLLPRIGHVVLERVPS
ncbi:MULTISPECIES: cation:proton antiporter [unclassified Acidisoma]|jgi:Kef-type K+ transport system membrane component KefB|uniref:cation:proton antiporter n=1 Tax=unclassified Acidisoma TaxID=2634065 RepID=UPI00131DA327|nr:MULTISPECIES: cation:proton antiporter [unclassified Acidisoma]